MFQKFMPTFKVVGGLNLTGLRNGHMLAQSPAYGANAGGSSFPLVATKIVGDHKFIENGIIVGIGAGGVIENYDPEAHAVPFLHFTEELSSGPLDGLNQFAVETVAGKPSYPRCVALYVGDSFITNNVAGDLDSAPVLKFVVTSGILTVDATGGGFIGTKTVMPDGSAGVEVTYVGKILAQLDLPDADEDGGYYARKDGAWVKIDDVFLTDADEDGALYARQGGDWVEVEQNFLEDADEDGVAYGRKDGKWVAVEEADSGL